MTVREFASTIRRFFCSQSTALIFTAWIAHAPVALPDTDPFAAATRAFEAGDFARALDLFEAAGADSARGAAVRYNIAVCQYKLGLYRQAESGFRALGEEFPNMRGLAEYNLGLTLLARRRTERARAAFQRAESTADPTLAELARRALATLPAATAPARGWLGSADLAFGYDDNVALSDDSSLPAGESGSSSFAQAFAYTSREFEPRAAPRLDVSGYVIRYPEASAFDQDVLQIGGAFEGLVGRWQLEAGPHFSYSTLGGDGFERDVGAAIALARSFGERLSFEWRLSRDDVEDVEPQFGFIDGERERSRFGVEYRRSTARWWVTYDLERNDRRSASVTSDRSRVTVRRRAPINLDWNLDLAASYRTTEHDRLAPPSSERLTELSASAERALSGGWILDIEYYRATNDSPIVEFSYDRSRVLVGFGKGF